MSKTHIIIFCLIFWFVFYDECFEFSNFIVTNYAFIFFQVRRFFSISVLPFPFSKQYVSVDLKFVPCLRLKIYFILSFFIYIVVD